MFNPQTCFRFSLRTKFFLLFLFAQGSKLFILKLNLPLRFIYSHLWSSFISFSGAAFFNVRTTLAVLYSTEASIRFLKTNNFSFLFHFLFLSATWGHQSPRISKIPLLLLIVHRYQCIKLKHCLSVTTTATVLQTTSTNIPKRTEFENVGKVMRNRDFGISFSWNSSTGRKIYRVALDAGREASSIFLRHQRRRDFPAVEAVEHCRSVYTVLYTPHQSIFPSSTRKGSFPWKFVTTCFLRSPTEIFVFATWC